MSHSKRNYYIIFGFLFFLSIVFSYNYSTFYGLKNNTGYTYGTIVENWESGKRKHDYSRYQYEVDGTVYQGRQGDKYSKEELVVIVYDKENPEYSMIAEYPFDLLNADKDTLEIEEKHVNYGWWDYLPADNISDLWKK